MIVRLTKTRYVNLAAVASIAFRPDTEANGQSSPGFMAQLYTLAGPVTLRGHEAEALQGILPELLDADCCQEVDPESVPVAPLPEPVPVI